MFCITGWDFSWTAYVEKMSWLYHRDRVSSELTTYTDGKKLRVSDSTVMDTQTALYDGVSILQGAYVTNLIAAGGSMWAGHV